MLGQKVGVAWVVVVECSILMLPWYRNARTQTHQQRKRVVQGLLYAVRSRRCDVEVVAVSAGVPGGSRVVVVVWVLLTGTPEYLTAQINGWMMCNRGGGGRRRGVDVDGEGKGTYVGEMLESSADSEAMILFS